ncbi:MAG: phage holin family protein [Bacilli bacterium]|nr:phage holin family protein [Bacilli bacterium]
MIKIIIGLICVMISNVLLGCSLATIKKEWNKNKFLNGLFKAFFIIISCILLYLCSYLNPNILIISIDGNNLNLIDGMKVIFISGISLYGYNDLIKLKEMFTIKVDFKEKEYEKETEIGIG